MRWLVAFSVCLALAVAGPKASSSKTMRFALDLFRTADPGAPSENFIISPLSPQILLSQLSDGCSKSARDELSRVVQLSSDEASHLSGELTKIANDESSPNKLEIASAIFKSVHMELSGKYNLARKANKVRLESVDFSKTNEAVQKINEWASQMTRGNIPTIVSADTLTPDMAMLLLNAIYFKGSWQYKFNETDTDKGGKFEVTKGHKVPAHMMLQSNKLRFGTVIFDAQQELGLRWVELPYDGDKLGMILLLPTKRHQLDVMLRQLTPEHMQDVFNTIDQNYNPIKIHVKLPKFSIKNEVQLVEPLKQLGIKRIFEDNSALSEMSRTPTKVADAKQDVFFSVDENGSTATAVSSIGTIPLSLNPYADIDFTCDEPFAAIIVDKTNRTPLFMAKIRQPTVVN